MTRKEYPRAVGKILQKVDSTVAHLIQNAFGTITEFVEVCCLRSAVLPLFITSLVSIHRTGQSQLNRAPPSSDSHQNAEAVYFGYKAFNVPPGFFSRNKTQKTVLGGEFHMRKEKQRPSKRTMLKST